MYTYNDVDQYAHMYDLLMSIRSVSMSHIIKSKRRYC